MKKINRKVMPVALSAAAFMFVAAFVFAASTSQFTLRINQGTLSVDIVDALYVPVGAPVVAFAPVSAKTDCMAGASRASGVLGTATQQIYVQNPDASDTGWTIALAAASPTTTWTGLVPANKFDFNDTECTDEIDTDLFAGQLTVDTVGATLAKAKCVNCDTTSIDLLATPTAFAEGTQNSITLINAASASSDIGDWTLQGVNLKQSIPAGQASDDYSIAMALTVTAQ